MVIYYKDGEEGPLRPARTMASLPTAGERPGPDDPQDDPASGRHLQETREHTGAFA